MLKNLIIALFATVGILSCTSEGENTGIEYAPDMYNSKAYEPFSQLKHMDYNSGGMTMRVPVRGTIARGQLDYEYSYDNTPEGYEASSADVNPVKYTEENLLEGERLYNIYCWSCHGKEGKNDGPVISVGKFAKPPFANYQDPYIQNLADGKMYHVITYGKNMMGSHAHMLTPTQRWQVINYVKKLSRNASTNPAPVDSVAAATIDTTIKAN